MTDTLKQALLEPSRRPAVVRDLHELVDAEVAEKSGVSGMAVKGGYSVLKKMNAQFVPDAIDSMLDAFVERTEPFYADFRAGGSGSLEQYFAQRPAEVANALLGVTDDRAQASQRDSVKKVYAKLRPQAQKHVEEALPRLAAVIERHVTAAA
ncbi:hypothetical protein CLV30_10480 [Haloactinopolyspora alba]|uniref:Uncharacterized protein n=1 Tax=Haloactinopolyspora alba TaxID=648780 RepID=A0A2P8E6X4_9ACTN|nr:hypothetical protein [Haloactinopolyspora alba]PSL05214.1 hypothetical protein CLV30_10480 [Haloactinopolyspora alba]